MLSRTHSNATRPRSSLFLTTLTTLTTLSTLSSLAALAGGCGDGADTSSGSGGTGGTGGSGGTGGAADCSTPPPEIPSAQAVNVDIENTTAADRYVLLACQDCESLRVAKKGDLDYISQPLAVTAALACGCECPAPPAGYPLAYRRIKAGETFTAAWDARTLATCVDEEDCGGGMTASTTNGALQPAGPGDYRVEFGIVEDLPPECTQTGATDDFTCTQPPQAGIDPGGGWFPVEVTLPEAGDVSAKLSLQ